MAKVCYRCTWEYRGGPYCEGAEIYSNVCRKCAVIIGGQMSWSNIKTYLNNKNYFTNLVLSQIKNRNNIYNEIKNYNSQLV